jgi:D-amino-acid oxidase
MNSEILVIGGGVSGVTTGIILRLLGYPVRILCKHWIGYSDKEEVQYATEPRFASQYPAASIIPHSVQIEDQAWHMRTNLRLFEALHFMSIAAVRKQRHYEIYETPVPVANYASAMPGYRALPSDGSGEYGAPRRFKEVSIFGWSFQTLFVEMPKYRRLLADVYCGLGGEVEIEEISDEISVIARNHRVVVNCAGAWAPGIFGDFAVSRFVKGILVLVGAKGHIPWNRSTGEVFSYNYFPDSSIYSRPNGAAADVYCYPRSDGWLLGGTRLESKDLAFERDHAFNSVTRWEGEQWNGATIDLPGMDASDLKIAVPLPVIELNRRIISELSGHDIMNYQLTAMEGLRHQRVKVRIEREQKHSMDVIHNYGHGGAGVTLSWSCALKVASLIEKERCFDMADVERLLLLAVDRYSSDLGV